MEGHTAQADQAPEDMRQRPPAEGGGRGILHGLLLLAGGIPPPRGGYRGPRRLRRHRERHRRRRWGREEHPRDRRCADAPQVDPAPRAAELLRGPGGLGLRESLRARGARQAHLRRHVPAVRRAPHRQRLRRSVQTSGDVEAGGLPQPHGEDSDTLAGPLHRAAGAALAHGGLRHLRHVAADPRGLRQVVRPPLEVLRSDLRRRVVRPPGGLAAGGGQTDADAGPAELPLPAALPRRGARAAGGPAGRRRPRPRRRRLR
mmetsp:Transcript_28581/g.85040  ORF Transcript_28581/g.85040 Transcript_28581/m.85040 type:complete len:259 (-) Transcript_28581:42-818(-)